MSKLKVVIASVLMAGVVASHALAADLLEKPLTLVVPYAPGGSSDFTARVLASRLTDIWKRNVIVVNKPGASGLVGAQNVATQKPDGETMLYAGPAITIASSLTPNASVDVLHDLLPITLTVSSPYVVVVNAKLPVHNLKELVDYVKGHPDFRWGASAYGSTDMIGLDLLNQKLGIKPDILPYVGEAGMITATLQDEIGGGLSSVSTAKQFADSGRIREIAITGTDPIDLAPGVQPVASQGYPGYDITVWYGVFAPKGTPKEAVDKIYSGVTTALKDPDVVKKMESTGNGIRISKNPAEFAAFFQKTYDEFGTVVKDLGLHPQ